MFARRIRKPADHTWAACTALACLIAGETVQAQEQEWTIALQGDVSIRVLVGHPHKKAPRGVVVLFAGGDGRLQLDGRGHPARMRNNFLVRVRPLLQQAGFITALVDAPSDRQRRPGLLSGYRASRTHAARDVGGVVERLSGRFRRPVFVIGTSRGSVSAANAAHRLGKRLQGAVLTASLTKPNRKGATINTVALKQITVPTLFVHHRADACHVTTLEDARASFEKMRKAKARVTWATVTGGEAGLSPCTGRSYHGFWKAEARAVQHITAWLDEVLASSR